MQRTILGIAMGLAALAVTVRAEIKFISGPAKADVGEQGIVDIPKGWQFVPKESMEEFDKATENLYSPDELGVLIAPKGIKGEFWAFFQFEEIGYIKDAASEKLDADAMWKSMQENSVEANKQRKEANYATSELVAWTLKPAYNPQTQRLEWAYQFSSQGKETVNYNTRILGRRGVMKVTVVPMGSLEDTLALFNQTIAGFEYKDGQRYAQFTSGDSLAKAGLAALVVGGAAAAAAKSGLLGKFFKFILIGLLAAGALIKKFWGKLKGKNQAEPGTGPGTQA